jgi:hypothetical protein
MILPREGGEWALYVSVSGHVFDVSEKLPYEEDGKVYRMVGEDGRTENFKELIVPERKQFVMHGGGQSGLYSGGGVRYMREDGYEWDWKRGVWTKPEKVEKAAATGAGKGGEDAGSLHSRCAKLRNELWKGCTQLAKKVQNTMPKGQAYVMLESVLSGLGGTGVPEGMLKAAIKHVFDEAPQVDEMWIVEVSGKTRLVPKELAMLLRQVYGEGLEIMPIFEEEEVSDGFVGE